MGYCRQSTETSIKKNDAFKHTMCNGEFTNIVGYRQIISLFSKDLALSYIVADMQKICVVLATYNGEKYLQQMLESLVAQTRKADIVIAVDDGSSDSTVSILRSYQDRLPLQITVSPQNEGHRAAFSKALSLAKPQLLNTDLIALADQDDIWLPKKLEILEKKIGNHALVFGDAEIIDCNGLITQASWRFQQKISTSLHFLARLAGTNNVTGCLSLFKANLLSKILPIPEAVGVHDAWIAIIAEKNGGIQAIRDIVLQYRLHGANAVGTGNKYSYDETTERQLKWSKQLQISAALLSLNKKEARFVNHLNSYWKARSKNSILWQHIPWLIINHKILYPSQSGRLKKVLFSMLGAPAVHLLFGKEK